MIKTVGLATLALGIMFSCGNPNEGKSVKATDAKVAGDTEEGIQLSIDSANSTINWMGAKLIGEHHGTLNVSKGMISINNGSIQGGKFEIDMQSLTNLDLEGEKKGSLEGHLKSEDFFKVDEFPTSSFEITKITPLEGDSLANSMVTGNLDIRGVVKSIEFPAMIDLSETSLSVFTPDFVIDRTDFGIKYGSATFIDGIKDKAIYDEMTISIKLMASLK